jgi:hypothetical protein
MKITKTKLKEIIKEELQRILEGDIADRRIQHWDTKTGKPLTQQSVQTVLKDPKHRWYGWAKEQGSTTPGASPEIVDTLTAKWAPAANTLRAVVRELEGLGNTGRVLAFKIEPHVEAIEKYIFDMKKEFSKNRRV